MSRFGYNDDGVAANGPTSIPLRSVFQSDFTPYLERANRELVKEAAEFVGGKALAIEMVAWKMNAEYDWFAQHHADRKAKKAKSRMLHKRERQARKRGRR